MASQWFVVRAISGQEKKVLQYIQSEIDRLNFQPYINNILIPTEKYFEIRNGKKRSRERNLYPGYIYIQFSDVALNQNTLQPEIVQVIKDVPGVVGFLGNEKGKQPIPLRDSEIKQILGQVDEMSEIEEVMENPYKVGETVKVLEGAFNGFTGMIEEVNEEKKRLRVLVKIFGRNAPVDLNFLQVERIE